jgi:hypothetical protein
MVDGGATKMAALTITGRNQQNSFRSRKAHGSQRGIEDDGTVSGADYPEDRLKVLKAAPKTHIRPPLQSRIEECLGGLTKTREPGEVRAVLEQIHA